MSLADSSQLASSPLGTDALFPLPLTVMEAFMVQDDRPEYPMLCDLEILLQGRIERAAFDHALQFALSRSPLFTAMVEPRVKAPPVWVRSHQSPPVDWAAWGAPLGEAYGARLDLSREPGLRVWVREGEDRSSVLLHFHHACADGLGGLAFIEDLLAGYTQACASGTAVEPRPLELQKLLSRGDMGPDTRTTWKKITDTWFGIREGVKFFGQAPPPLALPRGDSSPAEDDRSQVAAREVPSITTLNAAYSAATEKSSASAGFLTLSCCDAVSAGLRAAAAQANVTVNDLLLRDLLLVLRRWQREQQADQPGNRLRLLMPQSLRDRSDRSLPATNRMSFAFITRPNTDCDDPAALLQSIHNETEAIGRFRLSLCFWGRAGRDLGRWTVTVAVAQAFLLFHGDFE